MSDYVPRTPAKVVIGVCGDQASGKTVFLTCIFKSVMTAFPDDVIVSFDRENVGNANYFQSIEDSLIAHGPAVGTSVQTLFPARIFVKPYASEGKMERSGMLTVDLLDFAGRHFRGIADVKDLPSENDADPDDVKALREVKNTLDHADAFVILINSTEIDPLHETPMRNPFSASVEFMLSHCQEKRKPVALLFSQIDQTPRLTEELFRTLPRVNAFERKFTRDPEAFWRGERPFGIVQRISCFETIPGDLAPRKQTLDGSIWRREPAEVVLELLRAAMPQIEERLRQEEEDAIRVKKEDDARVRWEAVENERKERSVRRRRWVRRSAAFLASLLILGLLAFGWFKRTEGGQVRLLDDVGTHLQDGTLAAISPTVQSQLATILKADQENQGGSAGVRSAIERLESALAQAAQRLVAEPALDAGYSDEIAQFRNLVPLFDSSATEPWSTILLPMIVARGDFLTDWLGTKREDRHTRTSLLDQSALRFGAAGDAAFQGLLAAQSTLEKEAEIAGWKEPIDVDADLSSRVATMQGLLASAVAGRDQEFARLARKALAGHLARSILERHENGLLRDSLLTPLAAGLAKVPDGEVRFEVLASELLSCPDVEECAKRRGIVQTTAQANQADVSGLSAGVENLLRSLLSDRPQDERAEIWGAIADALTSSYLFNTASDAWPAGVEALPVRIAARLAAEGDASEVLVERIAQHPIYEGELQYLGDRISATVLQRQLVPAYSEMLTGLAGEGPVSIANLGQVGRQALSAIEGRGDAAAPLVAIGREIEQVLELVRAVNAPRFRGGFGDLSMSGQLERLLRQLISQHCSALASAGSPPGC